MLTESGERVGEVRDYEFDPNTFALTALSVPMSMNTIGEILTIAGDKVLTIGEDMIVVAADAVVRPEVVVAATRWCGRRSWSPPSRLSLSI